MNWSGGHYHYILPEKLSETSLEGRSVFLTMSGQLHMQDTSITLDNVREDDSWPTEFPRSILQTIDRLEALAQMVFAWDSNSLKEIYTARCPCPL
jgi:hypothetical protein